eukprot:TRINITY_DN3234_c0_g1_i1.p1 TRINITY_DN3234_c0_g1~~TRINITY_DN3234_c0_g1_i1.p1  ORF type:complete len:477 (-),score=125.14 TRINITY_DN3234_c0_g1_i1:42-1445(-)
MQGEATTAGPLLVPRHTEAEATVKAEMKREDEGAEATAGAETVAVAAGTETAEAPTAAAAATEAQAAPPVAEKQQQQHRGQAHHRPGPPPAAGQHHHAPPPQQQQQHRHRRPSGPSELGGGLKDFICPLQFSNKLPSVPLDPKFLQMPTDTMRYVKYCTSSLEKAYKHQVLCANDVGVKIDMINPSIYAVPDPKPSMPLDDVELLRSEARFHVHAAATASTPAGIKRTEARPSASWLRKTEYLDGDFRKQKKAERRSTGKELEEPPELRREDKIRLIEDSFKATCATPVHPSNPSLRPVEVYPIFPYVSIPRVTYQQVTFDTDPMTGEQQPDQSRCAILKQFVSYAQEQSASFVAHLVPAAKRRRTSEVEGDDVYSWRREYQFEVASLERNNYALVLGPPPEPFPGVPTPAAIGSGADGQQQQVAQYLPLSKKVILAKITNKRNLDIVRKFPQPSAVRVHDKAPLDS